MRHAPERKLRPVSPASVAMRAGYLGDRHAVNRGQTIAHQYRQCKDTGRIDAFRLEWKPGDGPEPHKFWDSDVAKWIEAASYTLSSGPDPELEGRLDQVIDLIRSAQRDDGYLNTHFTLVEPGNRWKNLRDDHELYCAGHLIEAAVAHYEATGKRTLLDVLTRYADYISRVFGPAEGQIPGYPGHEEIELALVKLYRTTGEKRYIELAAFFVDERGRQPHYFDVESRARGEEPGDRYPGFGAGSGRYEYLQAHLPVREQNSAEGHAVRAGYLFSGMADVAAETGDSALLGACERLWDSIVSRRMYITGGIGSHLFGERFSVDFDLPNEEAYAETCAAIALVFFAHRMLQITPHRRYGDVMERALYNGVLSGVSLSGDAFFYANPLSVNRTSVLMPQARADWERQPWYGCACCPPNVARLLASIGSYAYSVGEDGFVIHLYTASRVTVTLKEIVTTIEQITDYPWSGSTRIVLRPEREVDFALSLRIPGWCSSWTVRLNGARVGASAGPNGYLSIVRTWQPGDTVSLELEMPVRRMYAHPSVRHDAGRFAIQRGPLVYCLEEIDNGTDLSDIVIPRDTPLEPRRENELFGGSVSIAGRGFRRERSAWQGDLYRPEPGDQKESAIKAVPYALRNNRSPGEMIVWVREA